jgi:hypothetical protein
VSKFVLFMKARRLRTFFYAYHFDVGHKCPYMNLAKLYDRDVFEVKLSEDTTKGKY